MADVNNINADLAYRTAIAERGKFFPVDEDYLLSLGYPASGEGKYCVLTYQVNPVNLTLSGDITLGQVEIKDADSSWAVNVVPLSLSGGYNAMATLLVDENGAQITSFGSIAIAETTIPSAVADGAEVNPWYDEYGRQVIKGYNIAVDALDVNVINDATLNRLGPINNLNDAVTGGAGSTIDFSNYSNMTVQCISTAVTGGADVYVEHSLNGTNWVIVGTFEVSASGNQELVYSNYAMKYVRTRIDNYTDGTYNTWLYGGN